MTFEQALYYIKNGKRVYRTGWNGIDMYVFLVDGSQFVVNRPPLNRHYPPGTTVSYHAHIDMRTAQGTIVPWVASHTDLLSTDWEVRTEDANEFGIPVIMTPTPPTKETPTPASLLTETLQAPATIWSGSAPTSERLGVNQA